MKSSIFKSEKLWIWLIFFAGIFLSFWSWSLGKNEQKVSLKSENVEISNRIAKVLEQKRNQANAISELFPSNYSFDLHESQFYKKVKANNLEAFVYRNDSIVWWSNNHLHKGYSLKDTGHFVMREFKSWYQVSVFHPDTSTTLLLVFEIYKDYPVYNRLFQPSLSESFKILDQVIISSDSIENGDLVPVITKSKKTLFYAGIVKRQVDYRAAWLCLIGFLFLSFSLFSWLYKFKDPLNIKFHAAFLALFALFRFLIFFKVFSIGQNDMQLFSPEIYASSWYFPSLGELLLHQLLAIVALNFLSRINKRYISQNTNKQRVAYTLISGFVFYCIVNFCFSEMAKLVIDSHIGFNFYEIDSINIFTLIGLMSVFLVFQMLNILRGLLVWLSLSRTQWYILLASVLLPALLFFIIYNNTFLILLVSTVYCISYLFNPAELYLKGRMFRFPIRLVIACFFVTVIFVDFQIKKEQDFRKLIANKVLYKNEVEPIGFLSKIETQLFNDQGIVDYFTCADIDKTNFEQRLKSIYFSKKMSDFDLFVLDFDTLGKPYGEGSIFDYQGIYSIYSSNICKPVTKYFSQLFSPKFKGSYVGFFTPSTNGVKHGYLFVLLKPKFGAQAGRYDDVFAPSFEEISNNKNYSYAIYENGRLSQRYGSFGYELDLNKKFVTEKFISEGDNSHYITGDPKGSLVVLSKHENLLWHFFTNFTFLVVISIFGALLFLGSLSVFKFISEKLVHYKFFKSLNLLLLKKIEIFDTRNLFLSSKIQFSMVAVVFITFIITVNVTINYIRTNYNQRQNEFLLNKLYSIGNSLNNQSDINDLLSMYRYGLIYNLSNYNNIDINIYDLNGKLLHTSNDKIFEEGFIGNMMESNAYHELSELKKSEFFQTETLGSLSFLSGYHALLDNDLKVRGFLHLPYFSKSKELNREIASYIVALVNLFAIVFAVSALVAWLLSKRISQPLNLIRKNLGVLKLGGANTQIPWKNNDEIGLLIAEYNKMIEQLESSSDKLAASEREGAWREMAKQVAHEIKNPLTPMKLSLQHLQHSIARNDADIEQKVSKTAKLLIDQIDSLSRMAEEFSTFAKMPDAMPEEMDFNKAIKHCCDLFRQEAGFEIVFSTTHKDAIIKADSDQLNRVITNIIKNAQQAIPEGREGVLKISLEKKGNFYEAKFSDNGKGIEQELLNKIFSPNFSTKSSGMGLGLAISKKIIETFNGYLSFDTKLNIGTTFYIMLPAVK